MVQWFQPGWSRRKEGNFLFNDALNTFYLRLYGRKEGNVLFNDALNTFYLRLYGRKEGNVLFNDELNTFYLRLYGVGRMVRFKDAPNTRRGRFTTGLHPDFYTGLARP